jgi:hypothetical protein
MKKLSIIGILTILVTNLYAISQIKVICDKDGENIYVNGQFKAECDNGEPIAIMAKAGRYKVVVKKSNKDGSYYYYKKSFRIADGVQKVVEVSSSLNYTEKYYMEKISSYKKIKDYCWDYLKQYPKGKYVKLVKSKLDAYYWKRCNSINGCENYISKIPWGKHKTLAKQNLEKMYFKHRNSINGYIKYLSRFPSGKYVYSILNEIKELNSVNIIKDESAMKILKQYLSNTKNSFSSKAQQIYNHILIKVLKQNFDINDFKKFKNMKVFLSKNKKKILNYGSNGSNTIDIVGIVEIKGKTFFLLKLFPKGNIEFTFNQPIKLISNNHTYKSSNIIPYNITLSEKTNGHYATLIYNNIDLKIGTYRLSECPSENCLNISGKITKISKYFYKKTMEKSWNYTFGDENGNLAKSIIQTKDGGFAIAAWTGANTTNAWLIKLDKNGHKIWDKTFGGKNWDNADSIIQTKDGNLMVAGATSSKGAGRHDAWIIKLDKNGHKIWDKTFGGNDWDEADSIIQTKNGNFMVAGTTSSKGAGRYDAWIIKLDKNGNKIWDKTFGGSNRDKANSIIQTKDGGYIVAGYTYSKGNGKDDAWIIKLNKNGHKIWDKTFGSKNWDEADSIIQTKDGAFAIAGKTNGYAWIIKLDKNGHKIWDKTFGSSNYGKAYSIIQTKDGGFIVPTSTGREGTGNEDIKIVRIDKHGNKVWDKTLDGIDDDEADSIIQTRDGGYVIAGKTSSKGAGSDDVWVIKFSKNLIKQLDKGE